VLAQLADFLFPPRCIACADLGPAAPFCEVCALALVEVGEFRCPVCGLPFEGAGLAHLCAECERRAPNFDAARSRFVFGGPIADALHRFKYGDRPNLAAALGRLLAPLAGDRCDLIVPIPLHARRLAARGYDQAALLARSLARALRRRPAHPSALRRIRDTPAQVGLDREDRAANVASAFVAQERRVAGRAVLLVDDVMTTGATAAECARALKRAGASRVEVLTVPRAA